MPEDTRQLFLGLAKSKAGPSAAHDTMNTNAFGVGGFDGCIGTYGVVFKDTSRINHSCAPNANFLWSAESLTGDVRALRDIAPGEQITMSYTDVFYHYTSRMEPLRRLYARIAEDDAFRSELYDLHVNIARRPAVRVDDALHVTKTYLLMARRMEREAMHDAYASVTVARVLVNVEAAAAEMTCATTGADGGWAEVAAAAEQTRWWEGGDVDEMDSRTQRAICSGPQFRSLSQAAM
ncbi:hypothetical protein FA95DRAFT_1574983 [Auriscalpium vulgare]|uniref:Uncharacterized protein n=1 Tax=Auriscalpium vulgare TaxID=40419 RepID=A0ACB8RIV4_9AGAM|nr:hypothetical protein FA95DRAFT_1574983 [Auriscalpium vulgare]